MHSTQNMPTWQIFPDTDNNYRWVSSGTEPVNRSEEPSTSTIHGGNPSFCLPSMTDLLFQGSAKLLHSNGRNDESCPMFTTGLGKSVPVKQSSILKALSVLGGDDGFEKGSSKLLHNSGRSYESSPMFRTGLGKSVPVKQSSILKALSVLGGDDGIDKGQVHTGDGRHSLSNSLFQTGSGKVVNISSAGLIKAQTLLGLEKNSNKFMADETDGRENSLHTELRVRGHHNGAADTRSIPRHFGVDQTDKYTLESETKKFGFQNLQGSEMCSSTGKPPPVKFQTAGGRSISVSNDALQRAKSLLGDLELGVLPNDGGVEAPLFSFSNDKSNIFDGTLLNKENVPNGPCLHQDPTKNNYTSTGFPPPKGPFTKQKQFSASLKDSYSGGNLHKKFDTIGLVHEGGHRANSTISCKQKPTSSEPHTPYILAKDMSTRMNPMERSSGGPLVDISNHIGTASADQKQINCEKRRLGRRSSVSPFKRPRISRFSNPPETSISFLSNGSSVKSEDSCCKAKVSARYPFQTERMTLKKYFGDPPHHRNLSEIPEKVRCMNADSAEMYLFDDASGLNGIGVEAFHHMLAKCGVSMHNASKEWVSNHYKWIVWKLACYERWYTDKGNGKYLTVPNVLEELKYRYEREVNHSHRSALKRILEGDASPASMMVLCISAIHPNQELETEPVMAPCEDAMKSNNFAKMELTDGWYSVNAILDVPLSNLLVAGKLFVGQKLRIWRASLCGWVGPVSPLEASKTVSLLLHMNGTYRAHWADRLGFCKKLGAPLAFRCIKGDGGLVPRTLVGVTRVYPILYKERLSDGGSIVRSERMETKACQLYNERRSTIAEGIVSEFQMEISSSHRKADSDSEEGAKIFRILERAAEPDVIMAGMSTDQLKLFASYQAKQEVNPQAIRQSDMQKKIEKALEDAGLSERQVSPFMRLRVVGLTNKHARRKGYPGEGLITIWNPTDEQQCELVEGQAYNVAGLIPLNSDSATLYLQARGSTTTWHSLHPLAVSSFEPFFASRKSILLSNLGEVPLASEFDIAAVVVYVGDIYTSGHQKKQWMFVTDDSMSGSELLTEGSPNCLLAISFCSPIGDTDSFSPINHTLAGSTVGFFNLVKRARDQTNDLWVAEATDNSTYSSCYDLPTISHLKEAATSAYKWAKISSLTIEKLRQRALFIIGDGER